MGKQFGGVHISGKIGDVQYYLDRTQGYAKKSNPVSKDRILHSPEYDLLRKEISEFKGAAYATNTLQMCLGDDWKRFGERFLRIRLSSITRKVVRSGPGRNGQRRFEVGPNLHLLQFVDLNRNEPFRNMFRVKYTVTVNPDRNTATLDVPAFNSKSKLNVPGTATHFQLFMSVGVLTDFAYGGPDLGYVSTLPDLAGESHRESSAAMVCDGSTNPGFQLVASLPNLPVLPPDACLVVTLGIEFLKYVDNVEEWFWQSNAMMIHGAY
jgi:hypothetical protein